MRKAQSATLILNTIVTLKKKLLQVSAGTGTVVCEIRVHSERNVPILGVVYKFGDPMFYRMHVGMNNWNVHFIRICA